MKRINLFLTGIISLTVLVQISCSSSKTAVDEGKAEKVKQQIESLHYRVSVDYMSPAQGASRHLTSSYSLSVQGDTLISYLPYFGKAYNIPYGGGNGLNFTASLFDYSLSFNAKGTALISFRAHSESDVYLYNIEIFNNGNASIRVSSNNRQGISFSGRLEEDTLTTPTKE
ncbi:hypothetical protein FACS189451_10790 [Bacteroidia bacterium]|nr:hypothetical protein FACS189451_10790 [Bacteroidia bacterium]